MVLCQVGFFVFETDAFCSRKYLDRNRYRPVRRLSVCRPHIGQFNLVVRSVRESS